MPISVATSSSSVWLGQDKDVAWLSHYYCLADPRTVRFVHGFAKSRKADLTAKELEDFRDLGVLLLGYDVEELKTAIAAKELVEVMCDG